MNFPEICFWVCVTIIFYTLVGYPLLLVVLTRLLRRPTRRSKNAVRSVSIIVAAHNEEKALPRRLTELSQLITFSGVRGEVIVVSDGSTDGTAAVARTFTKGMVRVLELPERVGKAAAVTAACELAKNEVLVFADARQIWDPDALRLLLENFADPTVGAVSGDLVVKDASGVMGGVGLYWRFEKWLRRQESYVHSTVGVTGAICAVRRALFRPIPPGTLLDDVYWPLQVTMQGYRVIHDREAVAFDQLPDQASDEFRRKVRTLTGNFQLFTRLPTALLPWRNPVWFQLVSHKLCRLLVPWAMIGLLAANLLLSGPLYAIALWCQLAGYVLAVLGIATDQSRRPQLAAAAGSFLVLNAAAWLAFWVWISGRSSKAWQKVAYRAIPATPEPQPVLAVPVASATPEEVFVSSGPAVG